jgi:hypothetical protein
MSVEPPYSAAADNSGALSNTWVSKLGFVMSWTRTQSAFDVENCAGRQWHVDFVMALDTCFAVCSPRWISSQASGAFFLGAASFPRGFVLPRNLRPQCRLNTTSPLCSFILQLAHSSCTERRTTRSTKACQVTVLPDRMHTCTKTIVDGLLQRACNLARNMHILGVTAVCLSASSDRRPAGGDEVNAPTRQVNAVQ